MFAFAFKGRARGGGGDGSTAMKTQFVSLTTQMQQRLPTMPPENVRPVDDTNRSITGGQYLLGGYDIL